MLRYITWKPKAVLNGKTVEVKRDRRWHETGNLYIEVECWYNSTQSWQASGIAVTEADYWAFVLEESVLMIPTINVIRAINQCGREINCEIPPNKSRGFLITVNDLLAVMGVFTDMGWYREKINPTAFAGCDMTNVVSLFNHDSNEILSRTTGKQDDLTLSIENNQLKYKYQIKNECAEKVAENIGLGFITGSSFMFRVKTDSWSTGTMFLLTLNTSLLVVKT